MLRREVALRPFIWISGFLACPFLYLHFFSSLPLPTEWREAHISPLSVSNHKAHSSSLLPSAL
jgi:hypothetical protein